MSGKTISIMGFDADGRRRSATGREMETWRVVNPYVLERIVVGLDNGAGDCSIRDGQGPVDVECEVEILRPKTLPGPERGVK
jgi:hypothetical protein